MKDQYRQGRVLLAVVVFIAWLLSLSIRPPAINEVTVTPEPEGKAAVLGLQLARKYYYNRDVDSALAALDKAALSPQAEVAEAAQEQIVVINGWQTSLKYPVWCFNYWLLRNVWWVLLVLFVLWLVVFQPFKKPGYILDNIRMVGNAPDGLPPSTMIYEYLQLAHQSLQSMQRTFFCRPVNLSMPLFMEPDQKLDGLFNNLGSLQLGPVKTEPGKLLHALRKIPFRKDVYVDGSMTFEEKQIVLQVFFNCQGKVEKAFRLARPVDEEDMVHQTALLLEEAAYRIWYEMTDDQPMNSSRSLAAFMQALQAYQTVIAGDVDFDALTEIYPNLQGAMLADPANQSLRFLLGLIGNTLGKFREARPQFEWVMRHTASEKVQLAAQYNLALAEYSCFTENESKDAAKNFSTLIEKLEEKRPSLDEEEIVLLALAYCGLANVQAQYIHYLEWKREENASNETLWEAVTAYCNTAHMLLEENKGLEKSALQVVEAARQYSLEPQPIFL